MVLKSGTLSVEHAMLIDSATDLQLERILTAVSPADVFAGAQ
jgi:hypothetical protein